MCSLDVVIEDAVVAAVGNVAFVVAFFVVAVVVVVVGVVVVGPVVLSRVVVVVVAEAVEVVVIVVVAVFVVVVCLPKELVVDAGISVGFETSEPKVELSRKFDD